MSKFSFRIAELNKPPLALLVAGVLGGLLGESLLLLERQCRDVSRLLGDDLKVAVFLAASLSEGRRQVLEEKMRALPWVADLHYVPRDQALANLRGADPELVDSIAFLGDNPLPSSYELRPVHKVLSQLPRHVDEASSLEGVADIRYKPAQLRAILQVDFYAQFMRLVLDIAGFFLAGMFVCSIWSAVSTGLSPHAWPWAAWGTFGILIGMSLILVCLAPAAGTGLIHGWPNWSSQLLCLLAGGSTALSLAQCQPKP